MRVVAGDNDAIAAWVAARIPGMAAHPTFGPNATALGVEDATGRPAAGVVFHNWHPWYGNIEISCAAETAKWLTKHVVSEILAYPFGALGAKRITAITPALSASVSRFLTKLGFRREGLIRQGLGTDDAVVWGLLEKEWRFHPLNERRPVIHGKATGPKAHRPHRRHRRPDAVQRRHGAAAVPAQQRQPV